jgi:hypothetical protein
LGYWREPIERINCALTASRPGLLCGSAEDLPALCRPGVQRSCLACSPQAEGVTDRYFANRKPKTAAKTAYDTTAAARLWQVSADLAEVRNGLM